MGWQLGYGLGVRISHQPSGGSGNSHGAVIHTGLGRQDGLGEVDGHQPFSGSGNRQRGVASKHAGRG
ncbi:hypothetical protein C4579_00845 [Candidatus Microgenomates bacterium]|nr:MAG: hypothetical protein C4579_00845 [Candidatus Microgenomates bacterium]